MRRRELGRWGVIPDGRHDRPAIVGGEPAAFAAENARQVLVPVIFHSPIAPRCRAGGGGRPPRRGRHHEQARVQERRASNPAPAFAALVVLLAIWCDGPGSGIASATVDIVGFPSPRMGSQPGG